MMLIILFSIGNRDLETFHKTPARLEIITACEVGF
jgi:hypothetical protein